MIDWSGNSKSVFAAHGASNHSDTERELNDYYATDPRAMSLLLDEENFSEKIWECACGGGHLSQVLKEYGYEVFSTDLVDRGYEGTGIFDFLGDYEAGDGFDGDIITNPPYKYALEFVERALDIVRPGHKVAMFLKLSFLEGKRRRQFFEHNPPKRIYVCSSRIDCAKNADFENHNQSAICYAWFVWEKGFKGDPIIKWIN